MDLDLAQSKRDAVSTDLEGEREMLVSNFLDEHLTPLSLLFTLNYSEGVVTIVSDVDGQRELDKMKTALQRRDLEDVPILDVFGYLGKGSPLNV